MAGGIRGTDPRENVYLFAHAAGRHFRMRPTDRTLPVVKVTKDENGHRVETAQVRLRTLRRDTEFSLGLRALLGASPRKRADQAAVPVRVLTVKPHFSGRKTAAQLGLRTTIPMDWETAE